MYGMDQYTKLLIPGRGVNNSTAITDMCGKTITVNGNTKIVRPPTNNGYMVFDGNGDYLSLDSSADFAMGTGDFTLQGYFNFNTIANIMTLLDANSNYFSLFFMSAGNLTIGLAGAYYSFNWTPSVNTWYHIGLTRSGTNLRCFVNGIQIGTTQTSNDNITQVSLLIGKQIVSLPYYYDGMISNVVIDKGIARWTNTFTPPTTPTIDSYTKLYIKGDDGGTTFTDYSGTGKTIVANGNVYSYKNKFYGSSIYFDGSGDYLTIDSSVDFSFGSGNWTIDGWFYFLDLNLYRGLFATPYDDTGGAGAILGFFARIQSNKVYLDWRGFSLTHTNALSINTWYHIAIVRNGTNISIYINGTSDGSSDSATDIVHSGNPVFYVGAWFYRGSLYDSNCTFNGYMTIPRISKGIARWTSNFTPSARPYGFAGLYQ